MSDVYKDFIIVFGIMLIMFIIFIAGAFWLGARERDLDPKKDICENACLDMDMESMGWIDNEPICICNKEGQNRYINYINDTYVEMRIEGEEIRIRWW